MGLGAYSRGGCDLATKTLDEGTWLDPFPPPPPPAPEENAPVDPLPSRPYSAWPTVRPAFWFPLVSTDGAGNIFGALTAGVDVLDRHAWVAEAGGAPAGGSRATPSRTRA